MSFRFKKERKPLHLPIVQDIPGIIGHFFFSTLLSQFENPPVYGLQIQAQFRFGFCERTQKTQLIVSIARKLHNQSRSFLRVTWVAERTLQERQQSIGVGMPDVK